MVYPVSGDIKTEILINGTWTDISTRVRREASVAISRGGANGQGRITAQRCDLSLNNRNGDFSNRNPLSPYFGLLPRNTQMRVNAGTSTTYLKMFWQDVDGTLDYAYVADKASLSITGDTEVRVDVNPHSWRLRPGMFMVLSSKYSATSNQRSWVLYMDTQGYLYFAWSADGTNVITKTSTAPIPADSGRLSIKATIDVNNGAAGNTVAFYTATTLTGTYTQLGASIVTAGTTSIFDSTAGFVAGSGWSSSGVVSGGIAFGGRFYGCRLYDGIGGTLVATAGFGTVSVGDTTWVDAVGSTWHTFGSARVTSDRVRFWGEISALPQYWDKTGQDVYVPVQASGMIRRLTQGASPLRSTMYRNFTQYAPHGYWPLEDGANATVLGSAVTTGRAGTFTDVTRGVSSTLPGAESVCAFTASTSKMDFLANSATNTGTASFVLYMNMDAAVTSGTPSFANIYGTGLVSRINVALAAASWTTTFYDSSGTVLDTSVISADMPHNSWIGFNVLLETSGANVNYSIRWDTVGVSGAGVGPTSLGAGSVGHFSRANIFASGNASYEAARFSSIFMSTGNFDLTNDTFRDASNAFFGENVITRMKRLAAQVGIAIEITGFAADAETAGYQTVSSFMDLMYDCSDADQGVLGEARDALALTYRTRVDLENRHDLTLSYSSSHLSSVPVPTEDDQNVVNDVTARRPAGSFARAVTETGPLSVLAPPDGIGTYDVDVTVNVDSDTRLQDIAEWKAFIGSWDEARYLQLEVGLHRTQLTSDSTLSAETFGIEPGDTISLTDLPAFLPPDDVLLMAQGYSEVLNKETWTLTFNTTPAGPYQIPLADSDDFVPRADASNTVLDVAVNSSATSIGLRTATGKLWVTTAANPTEFPFDIECSGEVATVTAITGTTSPQTATVTRSVNGVVKSWPINAPIYLYQSPYAGL